MIISRRRTAMRKSALKIARYLSLDSEKGVTAIEYGLIASLIAVAIIAAITIVGTNLSAIFTFISGKLTVPG
jgi:pilus assembly protein Flp/PilA